MTRTDFSPEDEQDIKDRIANRALPYMRAAFAQYVAMFFSALGMSELNLRALKPERRRQILAQYPPIYPDMSIPGPAPDGRFNWQAISQSTPEEYAWAVQDFAKLQQERLRLITQERMRLVAPRV